MKPPSPWPEPPAIPDHVGDRVFGAVFGEAIGDALGHPIEGHTYGQKRYWVKGLPSEKPEDNKFTDDTQMFCAIGEALLEAPPHVDEEKFMVTVGKKFDEWRHNPLGGSHRAPGGNCMDAVRKLGAGVHWTKSGGLDFKGNGAPMRSGVVGAYYWKNPEYAFRIGALTSVCTHNNLEALLAAGMVAYLVATGIQGEFFNNAVVNGVLLCSEFEQTLPFYPRQVKLGVGYSDQNPWYAVSRFAVANILGQSCSNGAPNGPDLEKLIDRESVVVDGASVPAVAEAIYFNTRYQYFDDIVLQAVNNSDDTDTIGAIAGTIAGARVGYGGISELRPDWTTKVELNDYLYDLSMRLKDASIVYVKEQKQADEVLDSVDIGALLVENEGTESDESDYEVEF